MLDWFVQFAQGGGKIDSVNVGLTNLIDSLWGHWVESGPDRFARSHLLKQVATIEADKHISAVPASALGHSEQTTLGKLSDGELLRVRSERIQFSHDLLSDWSRLKVLVGDDWLATPATREVMPCRNGSGRSGFMDSGSWSSPQITAKAGESSWKLLMTARLQAL